MTSQNPVDLVRQFLTGLASGDLDTALADVDENIVYTNVSLPTVRGMAKFAPVMRGLNRPGFGFDVEILAISADADGVVLTERIDELKLGPVRMRFWVCGRFEVREGRITVWRDYFDFFDFTKGIVRALVGVVVPSLNRRINGVGK
ncbi:nuclear transport factor 2 family protein [Gordonia sp. HY285]|uniref:limonene-1,2-epoxide hydrolase family protein n=1 Tax=Gordonia liuliyuniae TaxID=2911517 RepID=UPI001F1F996D|nr:limonene-1,2-epoxide hydrolase family protein [Gordonia liuliyuniae]MCF8612151.1 nuclear transport factor 2 family protein [Gordonia liuliyuniae]